MTILSIVQDASMKIGLEKPDAVFASTDRDMLEMQEVIADAASDILSCHDWQKLQTIKTITGDDASEAFALPTDYERMLEGASMWSSKWTWAFNHIVNPDTWLEYQVVPYTFVNGNWMLYGNEIHVLPIMLSTETLKFFYVSNLIVTNAASSAISAFSTDTDTFNLDEKLLRLAIIYKWKQKKSQAHAQEMDDFEAYKIYLIGKDAGSKPVVSGRKRMPRGGDWAFPQTVGA